MAVDLFAGLSVADDAGALTWYEKLLGSPPRFFPNVVEAVCAPRARRPRPAHPLRRRPRRPSRMGDPNGESSGSSERRRRTESAR
jgi:hypothetical protein